jgi:hypothetical protein
MKKLLITIFSLLFIVSFSLAQSKKKSGKLDRKTYTCDVTQDGKKKSNPDELKFSGGVFQCKTLLDDDFKASEYETTTDSSASPPVITFTCEAKNEKEDVYTWTGTVTGDDIQGTATLVSKKGKTKKSFTYSGTLKGKKPKKN